MPTVLGVHFSGEIRNACGVCNMLRGMPKKNSGAHVLITTPFIVLKCFQPVHDGFRSQFV